MTDRLRLGADLDVSPYCVGMTSNRETISAAFDAGINFFFCTADMHWPAYEQTRRGLKDLLARRPSMRNEIVVGAVSYVTYPSFSHTPFWELTKTLPALGHLDLTIAGGAVPAEFSRRREQYKLHRLLGTRAFGASFHLRPFAAEAIADRQVDIGFIRYNALHRGAATDLFPAVAKRHPTLMYAFKTSLPPQEARFAECGLTASHWRPKHTDHYRYALSNDDLDGILFSPTEPGHIRDLADAIAAGPLSPNEHAYMGKLADLLHGKARLRGGSEGVGATAEPRE